MFDSLQVGVAYISSYARNGRELQKHAVAVTDLSSRSIVCGRRVNQPRAQGARTREQRFALSLFRSRIRKNSGPPPRARNLAISATRARRPSLPVSLHSPAPPL